MDEVWPDFLASDKTTTHQRQLHSDSTSWVTPAATHARFSPIHTGGYHASYSLLVYTLKQWWNSHLE